MESIRVKSKNLYVIEVNDAGETIEFDVTDIGLIFRLQEARKAMHDASKWFKAQLVVASKKGNTAKKGDMLTASEKATLETYQEYFKRVRAAIDIFAGEGASRKIFGNQNYLEMFNDFMEEMRPHIEKMQLKGNDIRQRISDKYGSEADDEI